MISFKEADDLVDRFEMMLKRYNIKIAPNSQLENCCLEVKLDLEKHRNKSLIDPYEDFRHRARVASGVIVMCLRLLKADDRGQLPVSFIQHLNLMNHAVVSQSSAYDLTKLTSTEKSASDKIFELVVGLASLEVGEDVTLDSPVASKGDNPDVLVSVDGRRWGFACKTIGPGTGSMVTLRDNIHKGIEQIERSPAEAGCVVVNLRNFFPHDSLNTLIGQGNEGLEYAVWSSREVDDFIYSWMEQFIQKFVAEIGYDLHLSSNKVKTPGGFLGYLETSAVVREGYMSSPLSTCFYLRFTKEKHPTPSVVDALMKKLAGENAVCVDRE